MAKLEGKISPAFEPFMREGAPDSTREAIVIYARSPIRTGSGSRLPERTAKLRRIQDLASAQATVESEAQRGYLAAQKQSLGHVHASPGALSFRRTLGVAMVRVSPSMVPELAGQPDVAAIMPNQRIEPIRPTKVDYTSLAQSESASGLTWGLECLDVPRIWETTRGQGVNVAVPDGGHEVAFFSSGASLAFPGQNPNLVHKPDVVAPRVQVWSAIPPEERPDGLHEYAYFDGTSMATSHVAGAAALLMSARPNAPVTEIAAALRETAHHPRGVDGRPDNRYGWGIIRPTAALAAL